MKGLYLTEEGKKEIEGLISDFEKTFKQSWSCQTILRYGILGKISILKEILSSSTILPVEESWENALTNTEVTDCIYSSKMNYPNGVIIKSKEQ
jgi:hypothetical protein